MHQNQILIDNYLGLLHTFDKSRIINEQDLIMEAISKEMLVNSMKKKLQYIEKTLVKAKVNVSRIKSEAKKMVPHLRKQFEAGKKPEQVSKEITISAKKVLGTALARATENFGELEAEDKIVVGLAGFLVILYINSLLFGAVAAIVTNPMAVSVITAVIIAPMVEEAAKNYFIQQDMPWIGTGVVFTIEAAMYIFSMLAGGVPLVKAVIARLLALLMHFSTTYLQKTIIDKGEQSGEDTRFIAWVVGVGIHASWNTLAIITVGG